MSASNPEVVVDHARDSVFLFLGFLFLEADIVLELEILHDPVQIWRNLRVQHLEIWKSFPWTDR